MRQTADVDMYSNAEIVPFHAYLYRLHCSNGFDVAVQRESVFRRMKMFIVIDMNSTLIQQEVIDELARDAGIGDKVIRITET